MMSDCVKAFRILGIAPYETTRYRTQVFYPGTANRRVQNRVCLLSWVRRALALERVLSETRLLEYALVRISSFLQPNLRRNMMYSIYVAYYVFVESDQSSGPFFILWLEHSRPQPASNEWMRTPQPHICTLFFYPGFFLNNR